MKKAIQLISLVGLILALSVPDAAAQQNQATGLAWGSNAYAQFGNGTLTSSPTPVPVSNLSGLTAVAGGGGHSLWLKTDGTVWASGANNVGQLGSGGTYPNCPANSTTPVQVSNLSGVAAIAGGFTHSMALKSDGTVWVWGEGLDGELGNGVFTRTCTPTQVTSLAGVVAIAAGDFHNLALKNDGTVWAWGFGINGQLGNGTFGRSAVPVQVSNLSGAVAIGGGGDNGFAVKSDGTAWAWGQGVFGLLGDGATANSSTPVQVSNLSGVAHITGGLFGQSAAAVKSDGTVWAWGAGDLGELGNGTTSITFSTTPLQVSGLSGMTAIAVGEDFHLALKSDGTVWAWGAIAGNGALTLSPTPVQVCNISGATAIAAGRGFSLAIGVSTPGCGVPLVPLTVTADYVTRSYGQANPGLTASYAGFINGDTAAVLSGALSCMTTATQNSPVANYPVTCSGLTSTKYNITFVPGQLTITQAPLTITANNATRPYGQANPAFTGSYSGFVNGEGPSVLSGTLSCTSNATPSSPVISPSSYAINCSGLSSTNYAITYVTGNLTITPVPLTITANSATKILNAALPAFSASYSAFANGENSSVLAGTLSCTTTATASSPIGSYPINCSGQTSSNYAIKFVSGTLKIIYAPAGVCGHIILPPIAADGSTVGKQGRTFPAKFQVCDANGVSIGTPGVVASFYLTQIITGTVTTNVVDIVDTNNPDTAFRWDGQQWIFNITTSNLAAGSTYVYTITLNDGSTINFQYGLQ